MYEPSHSAHLHSHKNIKHANSIHIQTTCTCRQHAHAGNMHMRATCTCGQHAHASNMHMQASVHSKPSNPQTFQKQALWTVPSQRHASKPHVLHVQQTANQDRLWSPHQEEAQLTICEERSMYLHLNMCTHLLLAEFLVYGSPVLFTIDYLSNSVDQSFGSLCQPYADNGSWWSENISKKVHWFKKRTGLVRVEQRITSNRGPVIRGQKTVICSYM